MLRILFAMMGICYKSCVDLDACGHPVFYAERLGGRSSANGPIENIAFAIRRDIQLYFSAAYFIVRNDIDISKSIRFICIVFYIEIIQTISYLHHIGFDFFVVFELSGLNLA